MTEVEIRSTPRIGRDADGWYASVTVAVNGNKHFTMRQRSSDSPSESVRLLTGAMRVKAGRAEDDIERQVMEAVIDAVESQAGPLVIKALHKAAEIEVRERERYRLWDIIKAFFGFYK